MLSAAHPVAEPGKAAYDLTVLLVNYNTARLLRPCLDALHAAAADLRLQVIVVDNASRDDSVAILEAYRPACLLLKNEVNIGFGRANNQALPHVAADHVLLLNTDAFVPPNALVDSLAYVRTHPECGVLGVKLVGSDGVLQPSCRYFPTPFNTFLGRTGLARFFPNVKLIDDMDWPHDETRECDWVPGCFYLVSRSALDAVGLFDPRFFMYFEEVDHCRAVKRAGWKVVFLPAVSVVHLGGESAKSVGGVTAIGKQLSHLQVESELLFFRKHRGWLGVFEIAALTLCAELYLLGKHVARGVGVRGLRTASQQLRLSWRVARGTSWGGRATR